MPASTLALGSTGYTLLEVDDADVTSAEGGTAPGGLRVTSRGRGSNYSTDVRARRSSDTIDFLGIGSTEATDQSSSNVSISAFTTELQAALGDNDDTLRLNRDADGATILMDQVEGGAVVGTGEDMLLASGDLTNSYVATGGGDDTVRITGAADGTVFELGDGRDSLIVSGASTDVQVSAGDDDDFIQFRGQLDYSAIDAGSGDDTVILAAGMYGTIDQEITDASVSLGDGNDSLIVRAFSEGLTVSADDALTPSSGRDTIDFDGSNYGSKVWLGGGDRLTIEGDFLEGRIGSSSSAGTGDTVVFGASSYVSNYDGSYDSLAAELGAGNDSVVFSGVFDTANVDVGAGADTIVFGANSEFIYGDLNLGGGADQVYFRTAYSGDATSDLDLDGRFESFRITGASDDDILYVGSGSYTAFYYDTAQGYWETQDGTDTLRFG